MLRRCEECGICVGASLAEESAGTNAMALALRLGEPVVLRGEQHWCRLFWDWLCAAGPVVGTDGKSLACVGVAFPSDSGLGEKLAVAWLLAEHLRGPMEVHRQAGRLTGRQLEIFQLRASGYRNKEIAASLGIREDTVEKHLQAALPRLGACSVEQAIARLARGGVI